MMKDDRITITATFKCLYEHGDCYCKNPANKFNCVGCRYGYLEKQTSPEIVKAVTEKEAKT